MGRGYGGMRVNSLDFEQPIIELEAKISELRSVGRDTSLNIREDIERLERKSKELTRNIFKHLTDWQIVQLARHPDRPHAVDYVERLFTEFDELHGDRVFGDDKALIGGVARLEGWPVMVIGQEKGRDTKEKILRNFGMPHPEGYRKALRLAEMAEQFGLPLITLIDTPGAYPGIQAEARGQSEAIARNLRAFAGLNVPIIAVIIGEGCSGGALGIGVADRLLMLRYSYYATISPEGCASILWKEAQRAPEAAEIMGITANKLLDLHLIDEVVEEPLGGAHRHWDAVMQTLKIVLLQHLRALMGEAPEQRLAKRYQKFMNVGIPV